MKKHLLLLLTLLTMMPYSCNARDTLAANNYSSKKAKKKSRGRKKIRFTYNGEPLVDVINFLAAEKGYNIILPSGANAIASTLTINIEDKLTKHEAWEMLVTLLDIAGYSIVPRGKAFLTIVKNSNNITKEPLPFYVGITPDQLPDTDERIRYLYYLTNMKVSADQKSELIKLLQEILPKTASYQVDPLTNALILSDKATNIKGAMEIIASLDKTEFQEKLEMIQLQHTSASTISKMFSDNILKNSKQKNRYRLDTKKEEATYFSSNIKVIPYDRTNSLIILGKSQAVDRITGFIHQYIDVELGKGKSILHIHQLQYLNAEEIAPVLQKIVTSQKTGGTGQSRAGVPSGTERFFDEVIIQADTPKSAEDKPGKYFGGNKLIIAARNDDWEKIKSLIEELDTPQPQVIIEVLVADLTIDDIRLLGSLTRNPKDIPFVKDADFQAAHINQVITDNVPGPATTIQSDLLARNLTDSGGAPISVAGAATAGSSVLSISDNNGSTWSILQVAKLFDHTKILSSPHVVAMNNQKAVVSLGESRLLTDESAGSSGGATTVKKKRVNADLKVEIIPKISSNNHVNLQVSVDVTEFKAGNADARITRKVITNANVHSEDILALGGLVKVDTIHSTSETPILGRVPVLGWFFKRRQAQNIKTNLTVFISPTIVQPQLRGGVGQYTQDHINIIKAQSTQGALFDNLKEPITRWFFKTGASTEIAADNFMKKGESHSEQVY